MAAVACGQASAKGQPIRSQHPLRMWLRKLQDELGLKRGVHILRHTFATQALHKGASLREVQALLGHTNIATTEKFSAPDVTAAIFPICDNLPYALVARVRNIGQAAVPAGVVVGFYAGDPDMGGMLLGSGMTKKSLYPAEAEDVVLELAMPDPGLIDGSIAVFVVVDDGMPAHLWKECRTTNNKIEGSGYCAMPG
jgi:hypothetical protein